MRKLLFAGVFLLSLATGAAQGAVTEAQVSAAITPLGEMTAERVEVLKKLGPQILPHLARIYSRSTEAEKATIAWILYAVGWKSPEARAELLEDIKTQNQTLRLQVQWALGRVSDDTEVVDILANIMLNDGNAVFRDKAACALAYDQIHLTEKQKVKLYGRLIEGLSDPKPQVRMIALQALHIHTGQSKGFVPNGDAQTRENSISRWKLWLREYEKNL